MSLWHNLTYDPARLTARWNGDANLDGTADANDFVGAYNGTWSSTAVYEAAPRGKGGGQAFTFNGSKKITTAMPSITGNFTISLWVKFTGSGLMVAFGVNSGSSWYIGATSGTLTGGTAAAGGMIATVATFNDGAWHHCLLTGNGTTVTFYVDGSSIGTKSQTASPPSGANPSIGAFGAGSFNWNGAIYDVRVYPEHFDSTEVAALYNGLGYWTDDCNDTDAVQLQSHTSDQSDVWVQYARTANHTIQSNRIQSAGWGQYYLDIDPLSPDYAVSADIVVTATGSNERPALWARMYDASYDGAVDYSGYYVELNGNNWNLIRSANGGTSTLATYADTISATTYTVRMTVVGTSIKVTINGTERLSATNTLLGYTGKPGLWFVTSGSSRMIDNFAVEGLESDYRESTIAASSADDWFIVMGQSNAVGTAGSNSVYAGGVAGYMLGHDYRVKLLTDPLSDYATYAHDYALQNGGGTGSVWPLVATELANTNSRKPGFTAAARSGTAIATLLPSGTPSDRATPYGCALAKATAVGGTIAGVFFWQGESDALASPTGTTYRDALLTLADACYAEWGCLFVVCGLQQCGSIGDTPEQFIRDAQEAAVAMRPAFMRLADLSSLTADDGLHITNAGKLQTAAEIIATAYFTPPTTAALRRKAHPDMRHNLNHVLSL